MSKNMLKISSLIFLSLFSLLNSQDQWIEYKEGQGFVKDYPKANFTSRFAIQFEKKEGSKFDGPLCMKIEVISHSGSAPLLCFSKDDPYCESREILVRNPYGDSVFLWVRKEQYQSSDSDPYVVVTCTDDDPSNCGYTIKGSDSGDSNAVFYPNFVYSYLVTENTRSFDFRLTNSTEFDHTKKIIICLEGSSTAVLSYPSIDPVILNNIQCVQVYGDPHDVSWGKFTVNKATKDEYITLSVHSYTTENDVGLAVENFAVPNGPIVSGLIRGVNEECFPISKEQFSKASDKLYITGKIHTKYAKFVVKKTNGEIIKDSEKEIIDGQLAYILSNPNEDRRICLQVPKEETYSQAEVVFSFQITDYGKLKKVFSYTEPMIAGEIYRRLLPKGQIAYYHVVKTDPSANKYDYTLSNLKGMAKLYMGECSLFPDCYFEVEDLQSLNRSIVSQANNQWIFNTRVDHSKAIYTQKDVMVVYCEDNELNGDYCEFETSLIYRGQDIKLIEGEKFYKYILKGEKGNLVIDLGHNRVVTRLTVDIMVFTGDVTFSVQPQEGIIMQKNYLSNKVIFNINKPQQVLDKVVIEFTGVLNSFFDVQYTVDSRNEEQTEEYLVSGENYLVQVNPLSLGKSKTLHMRNFFGNKVPFMTNFYSLNCDFEVKRGNVLIEFADGYAQDNIKKGEAVDEYYNYQVKIINQDRSRYNNKMCMLYVEGFEIIEDNSNIIREVVVAENINQQIIFEVNNSFTKIRFTYPVVNITKDFTYRVNVIDKAHYRLNAYINGQIFIANLNISVTSTYYVNAWDLSNYCDNEQLCSFSLDVEMVDQIVPTNPMIEITFREILNVPTYLQKGNSKLDFVCGDSLYYLYTDLGRDDVGEITLNFLREFGSIWARVVKKDEVTPEPDNNWRGIFRMPGAKWDDGLPFNNYTKKIKITTDKTKDCINGCYLLMTIKINEIGDYVPDSAFYYFSILVKIIPSAKIYTEFPKVIIQVDEFVVGALNINEMDEKDIFEFYEVWLPHDSDTVEFDWQSSLARLYVNVGGTRPLTSNYDFVLYPPGRHSVLSINKNDILRKAKEKGIIDQEVNSIQDVNLVIGIWTNKTDSIENELYALRVHQYIINEDDDLGIIEIQGDQKVICKPKSHREGYTTVYRCLFMISYVADANIYSPIYIYGYSANPAASVNLYGSYIDRETYNSYDEEKIKSLIPTRQTAEYNTYSENVNYIYIPDLAMKKYLFINLYTDWPDDLMLINSVPLYNLVAGGYITEIYPNSHTELLFSCQKGKIQIKFPGEESVSYTIEVISGEAEIGWDGEADVHKLKGADDRLTILSDDKNKKLNIRNTKPMLPTNNKLNAKIEDPGFFFFITYKTRTSGVNFDEIIFQKATEISYNKTDLPAILYCKLGNVYKDLNIAIQFKDNSAQVEGDYNLSPINVLSAIMTENDIYTAKKNADVGMVPKKTIPGYYDPAIKTALIYLSKDQINSFGIRSEYNPTLYLKVEKSQYYDYKKFEKFSIEAQVSGINDQVFPTEKIYHYGKLGQNQESVFYKLKIQKNKQFMRVQIAFNSADLDFTIHQQINNFNENQTYPSYRSSRERGKVIVTFIQPDLEFIYLNIFRKETAKANEQLSNYAFKFITAMTEMEFFDYRMTSPEIIIKEKTDTQNKLLSIIDCTFNKIHADLGEANITYFLKIVENSTYIYGEEINTIAVTESPNYVIYKRNPLSTGDQEKITLSARGALSNWACINIIAQVQQNNIVEYVAYKGIMEIRAPPRGEEESDHTVLFAVIGGVLGVVVIALVVVIVIFQIKNKSLLEKVKHVSFQKANMNTDPNLLLQKPSDTIN